MENGCGVPLSRFDYRLYAVTNRPVQENHIMEIFCGGSVALYSLMSLRAEKPARFEFLTGLILRAVTVQRVGEKSGQNLSCRITLAGTMRAQTNVQRIYHEIRL